MSKNTKQAKGNSMSKKNAKQNVTADEPKVVNTADLEPQTVNEVAVENANTETATETATEKKARQAKPKAVAEGPQTLTRGKIHKNGYVAYVAPGLRGSIFLTRNMFVGDPPESIVVTAANLAQGDPDASTKRAEREAKAAERKQTAEQRAAERLAKAEERAKKAEERLAKLRAKTAPKPDAAATEQASGVQDGPFVETAETVAE